ncbi:hypothetical protein B9Q01_08085 [Candidatus Marsarchaeota G1 archaeon OSP_D]|uniref:Uncharacterized protein n=1 Tax=Candidatus Marsarchaeota G1 archaeon OSP_D TaxID=1978155 RepID=A0A2R6A7Q1_9ARCH|nr:MAG: hypothetical protein B9Q01_08085 [Candidatus Marsarchaeota G1 archaeon OSP_D]
MRLSLCFVKFIFRFYPLQRHINFSKKFINKKQMVIRMIVTFERTSFEFLNEVFNLALARFFATGYEKHRR